MPQCPPATDPPTSPIYSPAATTLAVKAISGQKY